MQTSEKLQLIQILTGLTQEKLAQKLGVSFATINSWIHGKSIPRKNAQARIHKTFLEVSGQKELPKDSLKAKRNIIRQKQKIQKGVLKQILNYPDLYEQFILSLTFHSNRIEGSTLTENETAIILLENSTIPRKTLTEHLEVKNHQVALDFLFRSILEKQKFSTEMILRLHAILMNGIREDAGSFRKHPVRIVGAHIPTANFVKIPTLIKNLLHKTQAGSQDLLGQIAESHARFEQIHPFSDGNGRIGRLLIQGMLLEKDIAPAIIRQDKKRIYLQFLNRAQRQKGMDPLLEFICDSILEGYRILERI